MRSEFTEKFVTEKNGGKIEIAIRSPKSQDLKEVCKFYNKVINETEFLARITPVKLEDERKWLFSMLAAVKKKNAIYLLAEHKGKIIGSATIERKKEEVSRHVGSYGIAILQQYAGMGLGKRLTEMVIKLARERMRIEIVQLSVYSNNNIAWNLYRKYGFKEVGKIPDAIKRKGKLFDEIIMYKVLK